MRGVYKANHLFSTVTTAFTLFQFAPTALIPFEILSATITSSGSNTTNQQLEAYFQRVATVGVTSAGVLTLTKSEQGDQAPATAVSFGPWTTEPVYIANTQIGLLGWASLAGYQFAPVPEERPAIAVSQTNIVGAGLRLNIAPTSVNLDTEVTIREFG